MDYTMKLVYQSNYWYNEGLEKARIRDMSGAVTALKKSLQYNRANVAAMNLLGLVYYGRGDVVEALVEWIISKNFQPEDNIANDYIRKVQETPGELEEINQAVKRYNQGLQYAKQYGEDLAIIQLKKAIASHPTYVKAYQLLGFLYLHTEQYANARQVLRTAHKLDTTDELTLRYMHELNQLRKERSIELKNKESGAKQTVTYNLGNETIIQPVSSNFKEHTVLHTALNIGIGMAVGVLVMWFLIMPAMNSSRQKRLNKQTVAFSDQIATQKSQISALKTELEQYRASSEQSENAQETAAAAQSSYEILMNVNTHYRAQSMSNADMAEELLKINPEALGPNGKEIYDSMTGQIFPAMCGKLYNTAKQNFQVANYEYAVENLEKVMRMDEGYDNAGALLLLAQSYEKKGEQDKANMAYQKIVEKYPDTTAKDMAQQALDAQKTSGTGAGNGDGEAGNGGTEAGDGGTEAGDGGTGSTEE